MSEQRSGPVSAPAAAAAAAGAVTGADRSQSGGDSSQNESEGESTDNGGREFAPVKEAEEFQKQKVQPCQIITKAPAFSLSEKPGAVS